MRKMFDVGLGELLIIAFVAAVILGPTRCIKIFREAGKWLKKIETEWKTLKTD